MKNTIRFWSLVSGVSLLFMAVIAGIAFGFIFSSFYTEGNPVQTANAIDEMGMLFSVGNFLWLLIFFLDLIVTFGFYRVLSSISKTPAIVSALLRLVYSLILLVAIIFLFRKEPETFQRVWSMGLFIFGFHLIVTAIPLFPGTMVMKILGVLLVIAGVGYSLVHGIENLIPQAQEIGKSLESLLMIPMTLGELSFAFWLLIAGGRKKHHIL